MTAEKSKFTYMNKITINFIFSYKAALPSKLRHT
jgi:hypothetical protein